MVWRVLCLFSLFLLPCVHSYAAGISPHANVAVMDVGEYKNVQAQGYDAGAAMTEYVMAALEKESEFQLYSCDGDAMRDRLAEMGMKNAGLTSTKAAAEVGKLFGADYVVCGTIHDLGTSRTDTSALVYSNTDHRVTAHVVLRVVNVRTNEIVMAAKGEGESGTSASSIDYGSILALAGKGPGIFSVGGTINLGGYEASSEDVDAALQRAASDAVVKLMDSLQGKNRKRGNRG